MVAPTVSGDRGMPRMRSGRVWSNTNLVEMSEGLVLVGVGPAPRDTTVEGS